MTEVVVLSGKGGTGKTSVTASFAALSADCVTADCDVDASDLHLLLAPVVTAQGVFTCGNEAIIDPDVCSGCGVCASLCRFEAVSAQQTPDGYAIYAVDPVSCEGCGVCFHFCPEGAVQFPTREAGLWYTSRTRFGPMAHAKLYPGGENSGKLVTRVREEVRNLAKKEEKRLILIDGPPGIGCPVIASLTAADLVLCVTEPTCSGIHDFGRIMDVVKHFGIPAAVCVNRWDIHPGITQMIEEEAERRGVASAGRIRFDSGVTQAQIQAKTAVECEGDAADDIKSVWNTLKQIGESHGCTW